MFSHAEDMVAAIEGKRDLEPPFSPQVAVFHFFSPLCRMRCTGCTFLEGAFHSEFVSLSIVAVVVF